MEDIIELTKQPDYYNRDRRSKVVSISRDHPYYRTSNKGNISLPRLIMAEHLGRNLTRDNIVYHKDDDNNNNSIDNLIVLTRREFSALRDMKRLEHLVERSTSKISVYRQILEEAGIDIATLSRDDSGSRYREVDRDRELYEASRRGRGSVDE